MKRALAILSLILELAIIGAGPAAARNYDCSKAGNANKTACKAPAAPTTTAAPVASKAPAARHYDCSKAGNANKAVCKINLAPMPAPEPAPTVSSRPTAAPAQSPYLSVPRSAAPSAPAAAGPNRATALCGDGTYSHSTRRSGTCSHHGGVKSWY